MPSLNLYRRHYGPEKCTAKRAKDLRSYESDELRRGWKLCHCPIYASGTLGEKFDRKNTRRFLWADAKAIARRWEEANSWDGPSPRPPSPAAPDLEDKTIADAVKEYLDDHAKTGSKELTIQKYVERTKAFTEFSEQRGYVRLSQWTKRDVLDYKKSWSREDNTSQTRNQKAGWVRTFFRYAMGREWIATNPTADTNVRMPGMRTEVSRVQKSPFTAKEVERIFRACEKIPPTPWHSGIFSGTWSGQDVADFIKISIWTGLRISDVVKFNINRLNGNRIFLCQHKTGKPLFTWVPDDVRNMIQARAAVHGQEIFRQFSFRTTRNVCMTAVWRNKINRVFDLAAEEEPFTRKPTPHRFRHTFVRILLENRVDIEIVATLAGDTVEVIEKYYSEWCYERQDQLIDAMETAFGDKPKPKLIKGGKKQRAS
jgi:integrase